MKNKPELNRIDKMKVELVTLFQYSIAMLKFVYDIGS